MIDIIAYILLSMAIFYLAYSNFMQRQKQKELSSKHLQALLDLQSMKKELEKAITEINNVKLEKDDGFVKFLSESRDWAFQYIESTQAVISIFDSELKAILDSEDKPAQKVTKIRQAHKDLLAILPEKPQWLII